MNEDRFLQVQRQMAWERAKGELNSILTTYYNDSKYSEISMLTLEFIEKVEDEGLTE